jgi:hypothetical protein
MLLEEEVAKRPDIVLSPDWSKIEFLKCLYFSRFDIPAAVDVSFTAFSVFKIFQLNLPFLGEKSFLSLGKYS